MDDSIGGEITMRGRYLALSILALATGVAGGIAAERY
jgi:hypothetical protein